MKHNRTSARASNSSWKWLLTAIVKSPEYFKTQLDPIYFTSFSWYSSIKHVILEWTCQIGLGEKNCFVGKKNFYVSSFIVSVWQKYLNKYEHLNKDSSQAKNLSVLSLLWAFSNNVGLQTRTCYNLSESPHPASTAGLPQRKEFESMPTRVSSFL